MHVWVNYPAYIVSKLSNLVSRSANLAIDVPILAGKCWPSLFVIIIICYTMVSLGTVNIHISINKAIVLLIISLLVIVSILYWNGSLQFKKNSQQCQYLTMLPSLLAGAHTTD